MEDTNLGDAGKLERPRAAIAHGRAELVSFVIKLAALEDVHLAMLAGEEARAVDAPP